MFHVDYCVEMSTDRHFQRELRSEDKMQVAGEGDRVKEYMEMVFVHPAGSKDAQLLDGVFSSFLDTNFFQGEHFSFSMVLDVTEKLHVRFEHAQVPYLATVRRLRGPDGDIVVLNLPNNGFSFLGKASDNDFFRQKRPGWVTLPGPEAVAQFPTLQRVVSKRYSKVVVFCNFEACRIDMEFEPKVATDPLFMLTYEPGSPYVDTKIMRKPF